MQRRAPQAPVGHDNTGAAHNNNNNNSNNNNSNTTNNNNSNNTRGCAAWTEPLSMDCAV